MSTPRSPLPPDPRIGATSTYDRDKIIKVVTEYYEFLAKLPLIDPTDIIYPPPNGWPNITKDAFAFLGKTDEVIELLRGLPYIKTSKMPGGPWEYYTSCPISPDTYSIDYQSEDFQPPVKQHLLTRFVPSVPRDQRIPPCVVPLTYPEDHVSGTFVLLDTTDGTATDWDHHGFDSVRDYGPEDPRNWRNDCGRTVRLVDLLDEWKVKFEELRWVSFWRKSSPRVWWYLPPMCPEKGEEPSEETRECMDMQKIIRDHGWPSDFRREECKQALLQWEKSLP